MPTGYTAAICENHDITFAEFAMQCARAFGALVTMRDEPSDAPIPEKFEPSNYNADELEKAQARLAEVEGWDYDCANSEALSDYEAKMQRYEERVGENNRLRAAYDAMLAQVLQWIPPTSDHDGLKTFMLEQLTGSIKADCDEPEKPALLSGKGYQDKQAATAQQQIEWRTRDHVGEVQRANKRTQWVRALRESLEPAPTED